MDLPSHTTPTTYYDRVREATQANANTTFSSHIIIIGIFGLYSSSSHIAKEHRGPTQTNKTNI